MTPHSEPYDALLVVSFGGPERQEDVLPFLENVTRGKGVPRERLESVAAHYRTLGGKSPINDQCRALIAALEPELREHGLELPIYWGNRNWSPFLADTLAQMKSDGVRRALGFVTSTFSSYSGCRQYLENIETARALVEGAPEVDKLRSHFNHPGFIEAMADRVSAALEQLPAAERKSARVAFTAHSIPEAMASGCQYVAQLEESCRLVSERVGHREWQLVYQSRSGPLHVPWLGPDITEHLEALSAIGTKAVVVVPIGFLSDHVEVIWDLDREASERAVELEMRLVRARTVGTHPTFVAAVRELVEERLGRAERPRVVGTMGPAPDVCPPDCCSYERGGRPPTT